MIDEKTLGIISLTSYPARIKNVGKTIYKFVKMCPEFHIVLNLCSLEFPNKEKDLPDDLLLICNTFDKYTPPVVLYKEPKTFLSQKAVRLSQNS